MGLPAVRPRPRLGGRPGPRFITAATAIASSPAGARVATPPDPPLISLSGRPASLAATGSIESGAGTDMGFLSLPEALQLIGQPLRFIVTARFEAGTLGPDPSFLGRPGPLFAGSVTTGEGLVTGNSGCSSPLGWTALGSTLMDGCSACEIG